MSPVARIQREQGIVGRESELRLSLAVLGSGGNLLLEGPVGVGKTTVALAVCRHLGRRTVRVDGDERFTESRMTGWFDPPLVLQRGYGEESFFPGPLVQAMRDGSILFINEMNRMPETVQNVLLPALDERLIVLPRLGELRAAAGFQVVATQNPVEYIATGHLSEALRDRFEHVSLHYQSEEEERAIVARDGGTAPAELVALAVAIVRRTRDHEKIRKGASVRAAASIVRLALTLAGGDGRPCGEATDNAVLLPAAVTSLATRIELKDEEETDLAAVVAQIIDSVKKKVHPGIPGS